MIPDRSQPVVIRMPGAPELTARVDDADASGVTLVLAMPPAAALRDTSAVIEYRSPTGIHRIAGALASDRRDPAVLRLKRDGEETVQRREWARVDAVVPVDVRFEDPATGLAATVTLNVSGTLDTFTYLWHLVSDTNGQVLSDSTTSAFAFIPSAAGTYTFSFKVTDNDGKFGIDTAVVVASGGFAPTLSNLVTNTPINENSLATLSGNLTNTGIDTMTLVINWSDGSGLQTLSFAPTATLFTATHLYVDNVPSGLSSNMTIRLTLSDQHADTSDATSQIVVNDLPPTVTGLHMQAGTINENDVATLTGTVTDPGPLDTFSLAINWGDGVPQTVTNKPSGAFTVTHRYLNNIPGIPVSNYTISVTATDDDGFTGASVTTIETVDNVAPTANGGGNRTVTTGSLVTLTGSQTDPGTLDTFAYVWHLGDRQQWSGTSRSDDEELHVYAQLGRDVYVQLQGDGQ